MNEAASYPGSPPASAPFDVAQETSRLRASILHHCIKFSQSATRDGKLLDWCVDLRELLYRPGELKAAATLLWRRVRDLNPSFIGGMTLSAEQLVCGMLRAALDDGYEPAGFSVRRMAKTHGLRRRVEGVQPTPGARAVIVDDLFDTGETAEAVAAEVRAAKAFVAGFAAILDFRNPTFDRAEPRTSLFSLDDLGLRISRPAPIRQPHWVFRPLNFGRYTAPHASPMIDAAGIIAAGDTGEVVALDHAGREMWRVRTRDHQKGVRTALARFQESIVFCGFDGFAYRVDRCSGETIWSVRLGDAIGASPMIDADRGIAYLAVNFRGQSSAYVALDLSQGMVLWQRPEDDYSFARPALAADGGGVIVAANNGFVRSLARGDGELLWQVRVPGQVKGWIVVEGTRCFLSCFDGNLYALDTSRGGILWRRRLADWLLLHPAVHGNQVIASAAGHLCSLFQEDGRINWLAPTGGRVTGVGIDPARSACFAGSDSGLFVCVDLSSGRRRWQFEANDAFRVTPAVSASLCVAPCYDGSLYVFAIEDAADSGARAG